MGIIWNMKKSSIKANALDFGGLIVGVLELFEKHPMILQQYKERFQYILIDEYQDTNKAQFRLIRTTERYGQQYLCCR